MSIERDAKRIGSLLGRALFGGDEQHAELVRELAEDAKREGLLREDGAPRTSASSPATPARGPGVAKARPRCAACHDSGRVFAGGASAPCDCEAGDAERDRAAIVVRGEPTEGR